MLGIALLYIRFVDGCKIFKIHFTKIVVTQPYAAQRDTDFKDKWERMRLLATITIQPHLAKNKKITPEKLLPLPWDKKRKQEERKAPKLTAAQQRKRMEELVKKLGDEI